MNLSIVDILMQEQEDEDQQFGQKLRKRIKWHVKQLYERNFKHKLSAWFKMVEVELMNLNMDRDPQVKKWRCIFVNQRMDQSLVMMMRDRMSVSHNVWRVQKIKKNNMLLKLNVHVCMWVIQNGKMRIHHKLQRCPKETQRYT